MSRSEPVPPDVLAIAVALAVALEQEAVTVAAGGAEPPAEPSRWRWSGQRWERPTDHRWS